MFERVAFREPAIWRIDGDAIEAALAVGDVDRAQELLARFEERAARSRIPWSLAVSARCRGLVLAAQGELDAAAEALERVARRARALSDAVRARTDASRPGPAAAAAEAEAPGATLAGRGA